MVQGHGEAGAGSWGGRTLGGGGEGVDLSPAWGGAKRLQEVTEDSASPGSPPASSQLSSGP